LNIFHLFVTDNIYIQIIQRKTFQVTKKTQNVASVSFTNISVTAVSFTNISVTAVSFTNISVTAVSFTNISVTAVSFIGGHHSA
jgi:uncharacterized protein YjbI with pentapeptide repeats